MTTYIMATSPEGIVINVDNPPPEMCYIAGQTISGNVKVTTLSPMDLNCIYISIYGTGHVEDLCSTLDMVGDVTTATSSTDENYFTEKIFLLGNENDKLVLEPWTTSYPFTYTLPPALPASFKSHHGSIQYGMEARVKRALFKSDLTATLPLTIHGQLDLNLERHTNLNELTIFRKEKPSRCCLWCRNGPIAMDITFPKIAFVLGEFVVFAGVFTNQSRKKIKSVEVTLRQDVVYHDRRNLYTAESFNVICSANSPPIGKGVEEMWGGEVLKVPLTLPPTGLGGGCKIMEVEYVLRFEMKVKGKFVANLVGEIPIVIGTIPFKSGANGEQIPQDIIG